jgi:hypothetical protein
MSGDGTLCLPPPANERPEEQRPLVCTTVGCVYGRVVRAGLEPARPRKSPAQRKIPGKPGLLHFKACWHKRPPLEPLGVDLHPGRIAEPGADWRQGRGSNATPSRRGQALPKRFGPEKVATIVRRHEGGESARSLARKYGVAASAIIRLLGENNVVVKKRKVTDAEARRLATEYEAGAPMREVEVKHGLSHGAVSRALHRVGIDARPSAPRRKSRLILSRSQPLEG